MTETLMSKRDRLEKTVAGEATDRIPVALWRHWPGDDQRPTDLARATVDFQKQWDFDFVKLTPASSFCLIDYGVQDRWTGSIEGNREYTRRIIQRSVDWTQLRPLDPLKGGLAAQLEAVKLTAEGLKDSGTPLIQTIFSPLAQAKNLAGNDLLIQHIRTAPERVKTALNIITENILRFMDAMRKMNIAGIFYAIQHASYQMLSRPEYEAIGRPYDLQILNALQPHWWFNMLHLHGDSPMFDVIADYPVQAINWHDQETEPDLTTGKLKFKGAVCGGLNRSNVHYDTPTAIRQQAREAFEKTNQRRLILSTGCVMFITTPQSNIRAVRDVVETAKAG